jgi:hypothetical protein
MDTTFIVKALVKSLLQLAVSSEWATQGTASTKISHPKNGGWRWALYLVACGLSVRLCVTYGSGLTLSLSLRSAMAAKAGPASTSTGTVALTPVKRRRVALSSPLSSDLQLPQANT